MSTTIDQKVVEMRFDNKNFESNVATTMSTLDKLKQKLNFSGATKGLDDLNVAAKNVNMSGLGGAVESVSAKFSALQVMGVTALANITNAAVNAGTKIVKALTIDPIITGFQEYETQINSIQTILANTESKGSTLEDVTAALDELNVYADKTIYNFTEMTRNIGTFTAAGVGLEASVSAIKGIANLAAVSGSTSQQASTAMYQLSQALASGTVKLQDWNSVVNAGMGGQVFQDALKRTSEALGTGAKAAIKARGSFRESLRDGWLTTDVLTKTLEQFTMASEEGSEEWKQFKKELMADGFTEKQAEEILKLANTATDAATKVKTFTQLWDVMKEAAQSGWAQTWKIIVGDFEEARTRLTKISDFFTGDNGIITKMSDARNELLGGAFNSKWDTFIDKINKAGISTETFQKALSETVKASGGSLDDLIKKYGSLEGAIKSGEISTTTIIDTIKRLVGAEGEAAEATDAVTRSMENLQELVRRVIRGDFGDGQERVEALTEAGYDYATVQNAVNEELGYAYRHLVNLSEAEKQNISQLAKLSDEQLKAKGYTEDQVEAIRELAEAAETSGESINELIESISKPSGRDLLYDSFDNIVEAVTVPLQQIKEAWQETFPELTSDHIYTIIEQINKLTESLIMGEETAQKFKTIAEDVFGGVNNIAKIAIEVVKGIKNIYEAFVGLEPVQKILESIGNLFESIFGLFSKGSDLVGITLLEKICELVAKASQTAVEWIEKLENSEGFVKFCDSVRQAIDAVAAWIDKIDISESVSKFLDNIKKLVGIFTDWIASLKDSKNLPKDIVDSIINGFSTMVDYIVDEVKNLGSTIVDIFKSIPSDTIAGFVLGIFEKLPEVASAIIEVGKTIITTICGILGICSPSTVMYAIGGFVMLGLAAGILATNDTVTGAIGEVINNVINAVKNLDWSQLQNLFLSLGAFFPSLSRVFSVLTGIVRMMSTFGSTVATKTKDAYKTVSNSAENFVGGLSDFATKAWTTIKNFASKCVEVIKGIDWGALFAAGVVVGLGVLAYKLINVLEKIVDPLAKVGDLIGAAKGFVSTLTDVVKTLGKSMKHYINAQAMKAVATSLAILAASIALLVLTIQVGGWQNALIAAGIIAALIALLTVCVNQMGKLGDKGDLKIAKFATVVLSFAGAMVALTLCAKIIGSMSSTELVKGLSIMALFGLLIAALIAATKLAGDKIGGVGSTILAISAAMLLMTACIKLIGTMDWSELVKGLVGLTYFTALVAALIAATKLAGMGKRMEHLGPTILKISAAMLLLSICAKIIGTMEWSELGKAVVGLGAFSGIIAVLTKITQLAGDKSLDKIGSTIAKIGVAMLLLSITARILSSMTWEEFGKAAVGLAGLSAIIAGLIKATKLAGDGELKGVGATLISMSIAMGILALIAVICGVIPLEHMMKGLAVVGLLAAMISLMAYSLKGANDVKGSLIVMTVMIGVLGALVIGLSFLDPEKALKSAASLGLVIAACAAMIAAAGKLDKAKSTIVPLLTTLAIVAAIAAIIWAMDALNVESSIENAGSIAILLLAMSGALLILDHVKSVSSNAMSSLAQMTLVVGMLAAIVGVMSYFPQVSNAIANVSALSILLIAMSGAMLILDQVTYVSSSTIGKLALLGLVVAELAVIVSLMSSMPQSSSAIANATALSILLLAMSGVLAILTVIGLGGPAAYVGIGALATLITAIGAFIIAFGAMAEEWDNAEKYIDKGIEILGKIGSGLGSFFGGMVDGFMSSATKSLPEIGERLSAFMEGVTPFIDGVKNMDESAIKGTQALVGAISALMTANFVENIASKLQNGSSFSDLGEELSDFMTNVAPFVEAAAKINPEAMNGVKTLAETIKILSESTLLDGIASIFGMETSLSDFGEELAEFGPYMKEYSKSVTGIDTDAVQVSANAAKLLSEMVKNLPKEGGWLSKIFGETDASTFGEQLASFGESLMAYGEAVSGIEEYVDDIEESVAVGEALTELADMIPESGGFIQKFTGEKNLEDFGSNLEGFGEGLLAYGKSVEGISSYEKDIKSSIKAGEALVEIADEIPDAGGLLQDLIGETTIDEFGSQLKIFGEGLSAYGESVKDVDTYQAGIEASKTVIEELIEIANLVKDKLNFDFGETEFYKLGDGLQKLGDGISSYSTAINSIGSTTFDTSLVKSLVEIYNYVEENINQDWGESEIRKMGANLYSFSNNILRFIEDFKVINSEDNISALLLAKNCIDELVYIVEYAYQKLTWDNGEAEIVKMGENLSAFSSSIVNFVNDFSSISEKQSAIVLAKNAIDELVYVVQYAKTHLEWDNGKSEIVKMGENLSAFSANIVTFVNDFSSISDKEGAITSAKSAVEALVEMVNYVRTNLADDWGDAEIVNLGQDLAKAGENIKKFNDSVGDASALDAKIGSLRAIVTFANSIADADFGGLKDLGKALADLGSDGVKKFIDSFSDGEDDAESAASSLIKALVKAIESDLDKLTKAGKKTTKEYADGIEDNKSKAETAIGEVTTSVIDKIEDKYDSFYSAGEYVVQGFANGMSDSTYIAEAAARAVAAAAIEAAEEEAGIQSPSKEFYGMGYYCVAGFANAMYDYESMTYSAGAFMADTARSGLNDALSRVTDYLNGEMDMQPTIRPVLDLSEIKSGANAMNDMLNVGSSVQTLSRIGSITTMMNRRNQNGSNADVVSAIKDLKKVLGNISGDTYQIGDITYDDGSNISDAVQAIVRAARVERRR